MDSTDFGNYGNFKQLISGEPNEMKIHRGITITIVHVQGRRGYCLRSTNGTHTFVYDSQGGGMLHGTTHCKVTTTGRYGGKRTGPVEV